MGHRLPTFASFRTAETPDARVSGLTSCFAGSAGGPNLALTYLWGRDLSGTTQGAGGVGGLLAVTFENEANAPTYDPTYDGNGNITEYLNAAGAVEARFTYDAFGNTLIDTDVGHRFQHRFSTKRRDLETGLYYYGYRHYDQVTGRWLSRDPIGERGGVNLYGIVGNRPLDQVDVVGLFGCDDCDGKSQGDTTISIGKSFDCFRGKTDEEFLKEQKLGAAVIGTFMAANYAPKNPTPAGALGTTYSTGKLAAGKTASNTVKGVSGTIRYSWNIRQIRKRNNNGSNKCVEYDCKECKCCAIIHKSWKIVKEGRVEAETVAKARSKAKKSCP